MNKQKTRISIALFSAVILISCGNGETESQEESTIDSTGVVEIETEEELNPHDLILVNDQKWVIDEGMRISIDSIEMRMDNFKGGTLDAYTLLSADLSHHTKTVISNCTMTGQAHDELHKWLLPFIDLRKSLDSIPDLASGDAIAAELNQELVIFNDFFE